MRKSNLMILENGTIYDSYRNKKKEGTENTNKKEKKR